MALAAPASARYWNPVFGRNFPDPGVTRVDGVYYAYGTIVRWNGQRRLFPILRSRDLVHWRDSGAVFTRPPRWAREHFWAPSPLERGGRTYLYYSAQNRRGRHCVAVATSTRPRGPFRHRSMLACGRPLGYIDPYAFIDQEGRGWLYVARADPDCNELRRSCFISVYPLSRDLLRVAGPRRLLLGVSEPWEARPGYETVENPFVFHHDGSYYLLYSANDWRTDDYAMGYAVGTSPSGPFVKARGPLLASAPGVTGPGGGSVVTGPRGGHWLVYHARRTGFGTRRERMLHIDPIVVSAGSISTIGPTIGMDLLP